VEERRLEPDKTVASVTCRVCFAHVELRLERVEETPMYVYYRCQQCEASFPIRRADVEPLREQQPSA
jgi:hypothetical protein